MKEQQLSVVPDQKQMTAFSSPQGFEAAQRMALALTSSQLVPPDYRGKENLGSAVIALEIAQRLNASPLMVMQNLYVVHGKPAWSAQFVISAVNASGRFTPLRFDLSGEGDSRECIAWVKDKDDGERLEGPPASIAMAKAEGWYQKNGSKWQTMPEVMLRYRAASFFGRLYAPDILMGMQTAEEIHDVYDAAPIEKIDHETGEVTEMYETQVKSVAAKVAARKQEQVTEAKQVTPVGQQTTLLDDLVAKLQQAETPAALAALEARAKALPRAEQAVFGVMLDGKS